MFPTPHITNLRSHAIQTFGEQRVNAFKDFLFRKLSRNDFHLKSFPFSAQAKTANKRLLGVKDIPIEKIIGTVGRNGDFDYCFRPLKSHLRDRWSNVFINVHENGWPPIIVRAVEGQYYVEDGHHRTSIACALGMSFIQAEVWEYTIPLSITTLDEWQECALENICEACPA